MKKLLVIGLMVAFLAPAPGPPALAQSATEYGVMVNKPQGAGKLGNTTNHKFGSVKSKGTRPKHKKTKA